MWAESFTFDLDFNDVRLEAELFEQHTLKDKLVGVRSFLMSEMKFYFKESIEAEAEKDPFRQKILHLKREQVWGGLFGGSNEPIA